MSGIALADTLRQSGTCGMKPPPPLLNVAFYLHRIRRAFSPVLYRSSLWLLHAIARGSLEPVYIICLSSSCTARGM